MRILLVAYDNSSHISFFPLGLAYIASVCLKAGHEVKIYNQDIYHWPDEHLTRFLDKEYFDVVGIGVIGGYYQYRKLLALSKAVNASKQRPVFVIAGHGPSPEPEYFLKKTGADIVVVGEGEITFLELLDVLDNGGDLSKVKGIFYRNRSKNEFVRTPPRDLVSNIDGIPLPAWELFPMEHYALKRFPNIQNQERSMSIITGRGCSFRCNFCYRMDEGLRPRSSVSIVDEIRVLIDKYSISYFDFSDELLMNSVNRVTELCNFFLASKLSFRWRCNGRLNFAKMSLLELMKKAGCVFINYGIESMDDKALKTMGKALTTKIIIEGIENTLTAGISPGLNIIFGNIGETAEILRRDVELLLKYDDHAQLRTIRPVTPYPGSPLYYYAIEKGLLSGPEDFYERKHTNSDLLSVNFTDMSDADVHGLLHEANTILIERYIGEQRRAMAETVRKLYIEKDVSFRGFRPV